MNRTQLLDRKKQINAQKNLSDLELENIENIQSLYSMFNIFDVDSVVDIVDVPDRNAAGNITSTEYMITLQHGTDFTKIAKSPFRVVYVTFNKNGTVGIFLKHKREIQ